MKRLFIGGILNGQRFDVNEPWLYVPVEDGKWVDAPNKIVKHFQVYVRNGDVYELRSEKQ